MKSSDLPNSCARVFLNGRDDQRNPSAMTAFFITATGTDIGKTFVTTGLIRHMHATGRAGRRDQAGGERI